MRQRSGCTTARSASAAWQSNVTQRTGPQRHIRQLRPLGMCNDVENELLLRDFLRYDDDYNYYYVRLLQLLRLTTPATAITATKEPEHALSELSCIARSTWRLRKCGAGASANPGTVHQRSGCTTARSASTVWHSSVTQRRGPQCHTRQLRPLGMNNDIDN